MTSSLTAYRPFSDAMNPLAPNPAIAASELPVQPILDSCK